VDYLNCPRCGFSAFSAVEDLRGAPQCPSCGELGQRQVLFLSPRPDSRCRRPLRRFTPQAPPPPRAAA
jgi:hypothetical protein